MNFNNFKKIIFSLLIISIIFPVVFLQKPQKAEAFVPVIDSFNLIENTITAEATASLEIKEYILDTALWILVKGILSSIVHQIINWINSGFDDSIFSGMPSFILDPNSFFLALANEASGIFFEEFNQTEVCAPFKSSVQSSLQAVNDAYQSPSGAFQSAMTCSSENLEDFYDDFNNGGWDAWLAMFNNPQNNPSGAYLLSLDELDNRIARAEKMGELEAEWGQGFRSLKECVEEDEAGNCLRYQNTTPGKVIVDQLNLALGSPLRQLELADELEEFLAAIFNALINQLINQGLKSLSGDEGEWSENIDETLVSCPAKTNLIKQINDTIAGLDSTKCPNVVTRLNTLRANVQAVDSEECPTSVLIQLMERFNTILNSNAYQICIRPVIQVCGNGTIESPEQCDDGNVESGDGCSSSCTTETI